MMKTVRTKRAQYGYNGTCLARYNTLNTMSKTKCSSDAPVCPPMWNAPVAPIYTVNIPTQLPPTRMLRIPRPLPVLRAMPSFGVSMEGPIPGNQEGGTQTPGKDKDDREGGQCRLCGPRILGAIGVPNLDPSEPWPARNADGSEQNPFEVVMGAAAPDVDIREQGTYFPQYDVYQPDTAVELTIDPAQPLGIGATTLRLSIPDGYTVPSNGYIYSRTETIVYSWDGVDQNLPSGQVVTLNLTRRPANPAREVISGSVFVFSSLPTGNSSADIEVTIDADLSVCQVPQGCAGEQGINLKNNNSRGRNYTDGSIFVVRNDNLGGSERTGALIFTIRSTHWPDQDVSSCIVGDGNDNVANAQKYCCEIESLTPSDWPQGANRCAPDGVFQVGRPEEWPRQCPDGYEYSPADDGLSCQKCAQATSSFDPTQDPSTCPGNGVGCQKCCEDVGVFCP